MSEIQTPEHPKEPREPWREQTAKVHREMAPKARVQRGPGLSEIKAPGDSLEPRKPRRAQKAKVHREMAPKARVRRGIPDSPKVKAQETQAARAQESQESPGNQKCMVLLGKSMVFLKLPISENCNARKKCSRLMTKTGTQSSGFNYAK